MLFLLGSSCRLAGCHGIWTQHDGPHLSDKKQQWAAVSEPGSSRDTWEDFSARGGGGHCRTVSHRQILPDEPSGGTEPWWGLYWVRGQVLSPRWYLSFLVFFLSAGYLHSSTSDLVAPQLLRFSAITECRFLHPPGRFPCGVHSAVWNQGHLDVVCAPPLQARPHPGPSGHRGPGRCGEGKAESHGEILFILGSLPIPSWT